MLVHLHNPKRDVEVSGPLRVNDLVARLGLNREAVIVIRGDSLVTGDAHLDDNDDIEIRPVISGGALNHRTRGALNHRARGARH